MGLGALYLINDDDENVVHLHATNGALCVQTSQCPIIICKLPMREGYEARARIGAEPHRHTRIRRARVVFILVLTKLVGQWPSMGQTQPGYRVRRRQCYRETRRYVRISASRSRSRPLAVLAPPRHVGPVWCTIRPMPTKKEEGVILRTR